MKKTTFPLFYFLCMAIATWAQSEKPLFKANWGVQTYTFRNMFPKNIIGTLDTIKMLGFTEIEGGNPRGMSPEDFKKACDERGISIPSTGGDYNALVKDPTEIINKAKIFGAKYVMCAWIPHERGNFTLENAKKAVADFNTIGKKLKENGLIFCYHDHGYEFQKYGDGTLMDYIIQNTDPEYVSFEMDVLWTVHGGGNPVELLKKYGNRWKLMHVKDLKKGVKGDLTGGTPAENDVPVGEGQADFYNIIKVGNEIGIKHFFIEDESNMELMNIPKSIAYLKSLKEPKNLNSQPMVSHNNADTEWIELINGKDFTGWKASENTETWSVVDGMFQAVGKRSHLFYEGEHLKEGFKNFEIEVQVKTFKLANSGIYFHTQFQQSGWPSKGMEIQVNHSHIGEGDHIEYKRMASLYGFRNLYKSFGKDDAWMTVKARVENNRVQIWVDNVKTVDYIQSETPMKGVMRLSKGTFALQGHDALSKMQYRSFKVRRLPDDLRTDIAAPRLGVWFDSLRVWQGRQFAFIDVNPNTTMSANELTQFVYQTGVNVALVKGPTEASALDVAKGLPLFTGIKVNANNIKDLTPLKVDYILGESINTKTAKSLLDSKKINIWSHKGKALNLKDAALLLDLAKQNNVAIEINNETKTPSVEIIKLAKSKGCKFVFSGIVPQSKLEASLYIIDAIREAGLNYKDLYIPQ